jgi:hypothetical protein
VSHAGGRIGSTSCLGERFEYVALTSVIFAAHALERKKNLKTLISEPEDNPMICTEEFFFVEKPPLKLEKKK